MLDKLLYGGPGKIGSLENYEDAVEARLAAEEKVCIFKTICREKGKSAFLLWRCFMRQLFQVIPFTLFSDPV